MNYIRTLNIDEPLARVQLATNTVRYYHADALGSIIGLSDENGQIVTTYAYDAFGNVTISGEVSDNPFQYTGRENDEMGLYHYRARYYSPELQRFISEDPVRFRGGINFFSYVGNNPINGNDPLGLLQHWSPNAHVEVCNKYPSVKDRCECICAIATDTVGCMKSCTLCMPANGKVSAKAACACGCKALGGDPDACDMNCGILCK